jgi:flagellar secretion chaperone FliS
MPIRSSALAAYGSVANTESNPIQQVVMLYDGAIKFFRLAAADIESGDIAAKAEHSNRALDIVIYLQSILDFERGGEVAPALDNLYVNVMATALRASATLDAQLMRRAGELLAPVRDAWAVNAGNATDLPYAPTFAPDAAPAERLRVMA